MSPKWNSFLWAADQWLINYSLTPGLEAVLLFSIGHALELYLKACNTKITGDIDRAVRFGHNIDRIWFDCKKQDSNFLVDRELRQSLLDLDLLDWNVREQLSRDDQLHFIENQELYIVCKYLGDLKYMGAPLKKLRAPYAFGSSTRNPYWASLFHEIRSYLELTASGQSGHIPNYIETFELPLGSIQFLEQVLYG